MDNAILGEPKYSSLCLKNFFLKKGEELKRKISEEKT
jgi:hypothetical protein